MAQRDDALELLESSRYENARLSAELDRARSYKALYAAAYHVRFFFVCLLRLPAVRIYLYNRSPRVSLWQQERHDMFFLSLRHLCVLSVFGCFDCLLGWHLVCERVP